MNGIYSVSAMITFIRSTMMSLLRFAILVIFGVVTSQNHDVNSQIPYGGRPSREIVEPTRIENEGIQLLLTRFENLEGKVENLSSTIQELMDATRNLSSDSSLINISRSLNQTVNEVLQEIKDLKTATSSSCPLNTALNRKYPRNCREVRESEKTPSGNYLIQPEHASKPFEAVCELEIRGGGWTVIQRRFDGSQDFYLGWEDYKNGFGNLGGEFWFGLENIHLLTGFETNELLIELGDFESHNVSALYSEFSVGSEKEGYSLNVLGAYSGSAGDSLTFSAGMKFSTKDNDQDEHPVLGCAEFMSGAWWFRDCAYCNLNGKYFGRGEVPENRVQGVTWLNFKNYTTLEHTRMLVRPKLLCTNY